jgi:hypothetical protein
MPFVKMAKPVVTIVTVTLNVAICATAINNPINVAVAITTLMTERMLLSPYLRTCVGSKFCRSIIYFMIFSLS